MKTRYVLIIILALILAYPGFRLLQLLLEHTILPPAVTEPELGFGGKYCYGVIQQNEDLCKGIDVLEMNHSCMVYILRKKAAIEKNPEYCLEIGNYNHSSVVMKNEPYLESCNAVAFSMQDFAELDCGDGGAGTCSAIKKAMLDDSYDVLSDNSLTQKLKEDIFKFKAVYYQDESFCSQVSSEQQRMECILISTDDVGFCEEYLRFINNATGPTESWYE